MPDDIPEPDPVSLQNNPLQHTVDILVREPQWSTCGFDYTQIIEKALNMVVNHVISRPCLLELSVLLTHDDEIQQLNQQYRQKDKPTNVLSFESGIPIHQATDEKVMPMGDIVLAYQTVAREAHQQEKDLQDHFTHLVVHGLLHLLGFDHEVEEEAQVMEGYEVEILETYFDVENPYDT